MLKSIVLSSIAALTVATSASAGVDVNASNEALSTQIAAGQHVLNIQAEYGNDDHFFRLRQGEYYEAYGRDGGYISAQIATATDVLNAREAFIQGEIAEYVGIMQGFKDRADARVDAATADLVSETANLNEALRNAYAEASYVFNVVAGVETTTTQEATYKTRALTTVGSLEDFATSGVTLGDYSEVTALVGSANVSISNLTGTSNVASTIMDNGFAGAFYALQGIDTINWTVTTYSAESACMSGLISGAEAAIRSAYTVDDSRANLDLAGRVRNATINVCFGG